MVNLLAIFSACLCTCVMSVCFPGLPVAAGQGDFGPEGVLMAFSRRPHPSVQVPELSGTRSHVLW